MANWKDNWTVVQAHKDDLEVLQEYQKENHLSSPIKAGVHAINKLKQKSNDKLNS